MQAMRSAIFLVVMLHTFGASAQQESEGRGGLEPALLDELRSSLTLDATTRSAMNALSNNSVKELVIDQEAKNDELVLFSHKVDTKGITNQNKSGRCWLFATLNTLRPVMIKRFKMENFEFSYNYLFFYDKLEKSNVFLEKMIALADRPLSDDRELTWWLRTPAGDGGQWNMAVDLIEKYGLLPLYAMRENAQSEESRRMNTVLFRRLRKGALELRRLHAERAPAERLQAEKLTILKDVYRILALSLGVPPSSFEWRYENKDGKVSRPREMTPLQFYRNIVRVDLKEYVYLMNSPNHPYGKLFRIRVNRSLEDSPGMIFVNLPVERLKKLAVKAIKNGEALWFSADVGKANDPQGWLGPEYYSLEELYGVDLSLDKASRLSFRDSVPNHAMALMGVDIAKGNTRKWLVENSWGEERGRKGFWTMSDRWFDEYVYGLIINRRYLPSDVKRVLEQKPVDLPFYDPVWDRY